MMDKSIIKSFIEKNAMSIDDEYLEDDSDIFKSGYVNSLFAMSLINFLESEFKIVVENDELNLENFSTVNCIFDFVQKKVELRG